MKAFLLGLLVIVVISAGAGLGLEAVGMSAKSMYSTSSVRL